MAKLDDVAPLAAAYLKQYRGESGIYQKVSDEVATRTGLRVSARTVRRWARAKGLAPKASAPTPTSSRKSTNGDAKPTLGVKIKVHDGDRIGTVIDGLIAIGADRTATASVRATALDKAGYFALLLEGRDPKPPRKRK